MSGFDLYSDFIEPVYGANTLLYQRVTTLFTQLCEHYVEFCIVGDLAFSHYCRPQMTTEIDLWIAEESWSTALQVLKLPASGATQTIELRLLRLARPNDTLPFRIHLARVPKPIWSRFEREPTLTLFGHGRLPVVKAQQLSSMIETLCELRNMTALEREALEVRVELFNEFLEHGPSYEGYQLSWAELQSRKRD